MSRMSCEWPIDRSCLPELPELGNAPTPDEQAAYDEALLKRNAAEDVAVHILWALSGRQYGVCESTVRPCVTYAQGFGYSPYILTLDFGHWTNWPCGCIASCSVSGPRVVHLPGPAVAVTAVTINGVVLPSTEYQLEGNALYRTGGASWPRQDLSRPLGEPGTWSVAYTRGNPVPPGVDLLTGRLAAEFMLACDGDEDCRLPRTVVGTVRRGVSHQFDASKIIAAGRTNLEEVDLWLAAVNPHRLQERSEIV